MRNLKSYFIFLAGVLGTFSLRLFGVFYVIEIIAFASYLFIPWRKYKENPRMRMLIKMAFLWLIGAIVADIYNHTDTIDMLKGCFSIIFFIGIMPFVYWALEDNPKRWIWYVAGNGISSLLSFYLVKSNELEGFGYEIWQLYAWGPFAVAIAGVLYYKGYHKFAMLAYMGWAVYALYGGSRNLFLNISLAVCILYMIKKNSRTTLSEQMLRFKTKLIPIFIVLIIGALVVDKVYEELVSTRVLGEHAYEKYIEQKYSSGNILQSGRAETFMGLEIALENPIVGYGSFVVYKPGMFSKLDLNTRLQEYYHSVTIEYLPTHSHIIGYWVYHGILGAVFWIFILILMWRLFKQGAFMYEPQMIGHCIYYSVAVLWAICFSPFGQRTPMAFFIIYLIVLEDYYLKDRYGYFPTSTNKRL